MLPVERSMNNRTSGMGLTNGKRALDRYCRRGDRMSERAADCAGCSLGPTPR
jgi:hypothetical protein